MTIREYYERILEQIRETRDRSDISDQEKTMMGATFLNELVMVKLIRDTPEKKLNMQVVDWKRQEASKMASKKIH